MRRGVPGSFLRRLCTVVVPRASPEVRPVASPTPAQATHSHGTLFAVETLSARAGAGSRRVSYPSGPRTHRVHHPQYPPPHARHPEPSLGTPSSAPAAGRGGRVASREGACTHDMARVQFLVPRAPRPSVDASTIPSRAQRLSSAVKPLACRPPVEGRRTYPNARMRSYLGDGAPAGLARLSEAPLPRVWGKARDTPASTTFTHGPQFVGMHVLRSPSLFALRGLLGSVHKQVGGVIPSPLHSLTADGSADVPSATNPNSLPHRPTRGWFTHASTGSQVVKDLWWGRARALVATGCADSQRMGCIMRATRVHSLGGGRSQPQPCRVRVESAAQ
jgi:hypothetical protein